MQKTATGIGLTLESAIENALSAAKVPPPFRFVITSQGGVIEARDFHFSATVEITWESVEESAAERSEGTGELTEIEPQRSSSDSEFWAKHGTWPRELR